MGKQVVLMILLRRITFMNFAQGVSKRLLQDLVTGMSKVFSIDVYALLDPGATLYFVIPLIARKFDILPDIPNEPFMVTTPVGELMVENRVYKNFPIMLPNRITQVELVELDMVDLDVILGMDWFHYCVSSIDC